MSEETNTPEAPESETPEPEAPEAPEAPETSEAPEPEATAEAPAVEGAGAYAPTYETRQVDPNRRSTADGRFLTSSDADDE